MKKKMKLHFYQGASLFGLNPIVKFKAIIVNGKKNNNLHYKEKRLLFSKHKPLGKEIGELKLHPNKNISVQKGIP